MGKFRLFLVLWIAAVGAGLGLVWDYAETPGVPARPPDRWPSQSLVRPAKKLSTLVMVAHPQCPCTRASIRELARLMAQCPGLVTAHVLFYKPRGFSPGWERTDLWGEAASIPGVEVFSDIDGEEGRRFGAFTSGQTILYSPSGQLQFEGGITSSRGHSGDNFGRSSIVSILTRGTAELRRTPVFGCSLVTPGSEEHHAKASQTH